MLANPYDGNVLVDHLGDIPSPEIALQSSNYLPKIPSSMSGIPPYIRVHHLMDVRNLHLASFAERQLIQTTDLMIRQGYRHRDPRDVRTWTHVSGEAVHRGIILPQAIASAVEGVSGVGKTQACLRSLRRLPQSVFHQSFPNIQHGLQQVVWLSIEVPPSGNSKDLARALMFAWQQATNSNRFENWLGKDRISDGMAALNEWRQVASSHFLGLLHLDELQNLFKLSSLKQRKSRTGSTEAPALSIVEDKTLLWLLSLINGGLPLLFSGTPDGIGALTKRLSTTQRITTAGYHQFNPFSDAKSSDFRNVFLKQLGKYQYVQHRLSVDDQLAELIFDLTAGIQRIIIALWIAAHRIAFERNTDDLRLEDFTKAARTWLAPLAPAVEAVRSKDSLKMARYEDLTVRDTTFWASFWQRAALP